MSDYRHLHDLELRVYQLGQGKFEQLMHPEMRAKAERLDKLASAASFFWPLLLLMALLALLFAVWDISLLAPNQALAPKTIFWAVLGAGLLITGCALRIIVPRFRHRRLEIYQTELERLEQAPPTT